MSTSHKTRVYKFNPTITHPIDQLGRYQTQLRRTKFEATRIAETPAVGKTGTKSNAARMIASQNQKTQLANLVADAATALAAFPMQDQLEARLEYGCRLSALREHLELPKTSLEYQLLESDWQENEFEVLTILNADPLADDSATKTVAILVKHG